MTTIYIATSNPGKVRDFAGAASLFRIDVAPLPGFAALPLVHEDGETFEANARKKAECYSREAPTKESLVLADDSGLEVFSLNGAPGVHSARYASDDSAAVVTTPGEQDHDAANNARLLRELESVPDSDRAARFVCALAVAREGRVLKIFEAEVRGTILGAPRGQNG